MTNKEKVLKGLKYCRDLDIADMKCPDECPYHVISNEYGCCSYIPLLNDAIALLQEQNGCENCAIAIEDRQPVVRCKDCKFWQGRVFRTIDDKECHLCEMIRCYEPADWFCADGERRKVKWDEGD